MKTYVLGAVLALGILVTPSASYAAGLTSVQIQSILSLLSAFGADSATIVNVTTALNGGTPTSSNGQSFCHTWNSDMTVGSGGDDVSALNQALTLSGIDTTGNTSSFSENNAGDVVAFQSHYGIRQTGYVGPMTRAKLNALYGCGATTSPVVSSAPAAVAAPVITSTSAKAADTLEMYAGGPATVSGTGLYSSTKPTKVFIGGLQASVTYADNTLLNINVPWSLSPGHTYPLYVVNGNGMSNTLHIKILDVIGSSQAPMITSTSAKAADTLEMDAGGSATISGSNLSIDGQTPSVFIGNTQAVVSYASDTMLWINVPLSLTAGQSYPLYVVTSRGTSNTLMVKILSTMATSTAQPACNLSVTSYTPSPYTSVSGQIYVTPNSKVKLSWTSQNATSAVWNSGDKADLNGSETFSNLVLGANSWSITFSGANGKTMCSTTVYVDQKG